MLSKSLHRSFFFCLLIACLSGCALSSALRPIPTSMEDFGPPRTMALQMQLIRSNETHMIESVIEISPTHLEFIATSVGVRLFTLHYDGHTITEGPGLGLPFGLPAQLIINDLTLILLDDPHLKKRLPHNWTIVEEGQKREIYQNKQLLLEYSKNVDAKGNGTINLKRNMPTYELNVDALTLQ